MMRVLVVTAGSWGDVLPFVAPAAELTKRGHQVVVSAPPIFVRALRRLGMRAFPAGPFLRRATLTEFHMAVASSEDGGDAFAQYWNTMVVRDAPQTYYDLRRRAADCDAMFAHYHSVAAYAVSRSIGLPRVTLAWGPSCIPSTAYPPPRTAARRPFSIGARTYPEQAANDDAWREELRWAEEVIDPGTNAVLDEFGVDPVTAAPFRLPCDGDKLLLSSHAALLDHQSDWPPGTVQVGHPSGDRVPGTSASPAVDFARAGKSPVLVTFGTAVSAGASTAIRLAVEALLDRGERVLLLGPDAGCRRDERLFRSDFAPLSEVVPWCTMAVHHGGPGSTYTALRSGLPTIVIPQFLDQPLNAALVASARAGVHLASHDLTLPHITAAFDIVDDDATRQSAARVGERLGDAELPAQLIADAVEDL